MRLVGSRQARQTKVCDFSVSCELLMRPLIAWLRTTV